MDGDDEMVCPTEGYRVCCRSSLPVGMPSSLWIALLSAALVGCATTTNVEPQRPGTAPPPGQDVKLVAYNVAFGAVVGGVGALLNGDGRPVPRAARGAAWGALGGTIAYTGKWTAGAVSAREQLAYGLPARLVHDIGASVVENAAHGRPPLDRFSTHLGVVRVDVRPATGSVQARLLPFNALVVAVIAADPDVNLDLGRSLALGTPFFTGDSRDDAPILDSPSNGRAILSSVFVARSDLEFHDTAAHELIHAMQHHEFTRYEATLRAPLGSSKGLGSWVYLDSPALQYLTYYAVEGGAIDAPCKYDNWIEREAEAFASRRAVGVCP